MLSNVDIERRMVSTGADAIKIGPWPTASAFGGASVDLTLSDLVRTINPGRVSHIDFRRWGSDPHYIEQITDVSRIDDLHPLILHPGRVVICATIEWLQVPLDLCAELHGRSSLGRLGVVPHTAGKIDPGWRGNLALELCNLGEIPIILRPGDAICQIVFHQLSSAARFVRSRFHSQVGPDMNGTLT